MELPQLKLSESEIKKEDPWADDALKRSFCAETLTDFLKDQNSALTVALNGPWGTGKTFFLKRWAQDLKNNGHEVVYFNAWQDDCLEDPLVAIIGQLWQNLKGGTFNELCSSLKEAAVPVLRKVGVGLLNQGFKISTGISGETIPEECLKTGCESAFDEYEKQTKYREDFKKRLQKLTDKIFKETGSSLVFIVDELDRCRPDFAVKVLERIKHLFDINHVIFVLGIDREQLGHVIRSVYGDIDVENYLLRFIDVDFLLPQIKHNAFFNALWEKYGLDAYVESKGEQYRRRNMINMMYTGALNPVLAEASGLRNAMKSFFEYHKFSLREIDFGLRLCILILKNTSVGYRIFPELIPLLVLLKIRGGALYRKFVDFSCTLDEIVNFAFPYSIEELSGSHEKMWARVQMLGALFSMFRYSKISGVETKEVLDAISAEKTQYSSSIFRVLPEKELREKFLKLINANLEKENYFQCDFVKSLAERMDLICIQPPDEAFG